MIVFVLYIVLFYNLLINANKLSYEIKYAPILKMVPFLKLHYIFCLKEKNKENQYYAIDFTPLKENNMTTILELISGKSVAARIRIKPMNRWSLEGWKNSNHSLNNNNLILNKYFKIDENEWKYINLYDRNCRHFAKELINKSKLT